MCFKRYNGEVSTVPRIYDIVHSNFSNYLLRTMKTVCIYWFSRQSVSVRIRVLMNDLVQYNQRNYQLNSKLEIAI
jgi:hypothetical protein